MYAHLLFERAAGDAVAFAERAVVVDLDLGHDEKRNALGAGGRAFDTRQHQMHDILRHVVFAGGDENLGAGNLVAAVALLDRLGAQQAEIGAAMRLGQVHGAGPHAAHHLRQIFLFQLLRGMHQHRRDRALRQALIHREGHVGRAHEFVDRLGQSRRQALAAEFLRHRDADPAAIDDLLEGFLETLRRGDAAIRMPGTPFGVADAVERSEHVLGQSGRLAQDRLDHVGRGVGKARQIAVALDVKDVLEQKQRIVDRCFVGRHCLSPQRGRSYPSGLNRPVCRNKNRLPQP